MGRWPRARWRCIRVIAGLGGSLAWAAATAAGGEIRGRVLDATCGEGVQGRTVRAFALGRTVALATESEGDGSYRLRDVAAGWYVVCVGAADEYRAVVVPGLVVKEGDSATMNLRVARSLMIEGESWVQPYPSFCQSFQASGLGVTMVGVKGFGPGRRVQVRLRAGDGPEGDIVGPSRVTRPVGGEDTQCVRWSGGEAATVPGGTYTVELTAVDGQTWVPGVAGRGDVYAGGSAYFDGVPRPDSDLGLILCEDNDGLRTDYAMGAGWRTHRGRSMGQTFRALSRSITCASAVLWGLAGPPTYVRFSIHEQGPGGRQIGPSKGVEAAEDAAVAWGPGEVPVTPGAVYYLHIESFSGSPLLGAIQPDAYAEGSAFFGGRATMDRDLCAVVAGEITADDFARLVAHPRHRETVPLANASFEDGLTGWERYGEDRAGGVVGCDGGVVPMWGSRMFGWTKRKEGEGSRPTIYQQVNVKAGQTYCFSASVYTDHTGGRSSDVKVRLVVAPGGETDLRNYDVIESSQWYATEGQWRRGSVEFQATADTISVGFELEQRFSLDSSSLYVDGAYLERIGAE